MITYFTFDKELINRTCHILQNILRIDFYTLSFEYFILNTIFIHYSKEILVTIMEQFVQQKMAVFLTFYCELPTAITQNNRWFYRTFFLFVIIFSRVTTFMIPIWYIYSISSCIMRLDKILLAIVIKIKSINTYITNISPAKIDYKYWYKSKLRHCKFVVVFGVLISIYSGKNNNNFRQAKFQISPSS
jgi:hypothetical protein